MDKSIISAIPVDEQSIEAFATQKAEDIVAIDMTTPEYTADTCPIASDSLSSEDINPTHMKVGA